MVYLIGDTHFGDIGMINVMGRPFNSVEEMDETIIKNWNSIVDDSDIVIHLGDFIYDITNEKRIKQILKQLHGRKLLILGNHDRKRSPEFWRSAGFDEVYNYPIIYDDWYILSHEPIFINIHMPYANIFAHVHNNPNYTDISPRGACVSAERIGYAPVNFEAIKTKMGRY